MSTKALEICLEVHKQNGTAYITGGAVRDMLLGWPCNDVDLEVFGISQETLETILNTVCSKVDLVGKSYGIYKADGIDVGFPRRDRTHGKGADVEIDPYMSVEEAALRRDLTVNSMYFNPITMDIIDPFGGRVDLQRQLVGMVSYDTFNEDPLRPIRAARFCATLGLFLHGDTLTACQTADRNKIHNLPKERIFGELEKVLMEAEYPSVFFEELDDMDLTKILFPELQLTKQIEQGKCYHPEGSVYAHSLLALDVLPIKERSLDVLLAILFHDLGKASVETEVSGDKISFKGHAEDLTLATAAMARLTDDKELTESVLNLIKYHMHPYQFKNGVTKKRIRRLASKVDVRKLMKVHKADQKGREYSEENNKYVKRNNEVAAEIMAVFEEIEGEIVPIMQGRHLIEAGWVPGKHFGYILAQLYEYQLDGELVDVASGMELAHTLFGGVKKSTVVKGA